MGNGRAVAKREVLSRRGVVSLDVAEVGRVDLRPRAEVAVGEQPAFDSRGAALGHVIGVADPVYQWALICSARVAAKDQ